MDRDAGGGFLKSKEKKTRGISKAFLKGLVSVLLAPTLRQRRRSSTSHNPGIVSCSAAERLEFPDWRTRKLRGSAIYSRTGKIWVEAGIAIATERSLASRWSRKLAGEHIPRQKPLPGLANCSAPTLHLVKGGISYVLYTGARFLPAGKRVGEKKERKKRVGGMMDDDRKAEPAMMRMKRRRRKRGPALPFIVTCPLSLGIRSNHPEGQYPNRHTKKKRQQTAESVEGRPIPLL